MAARGRLQIEKCREEMAKLSPHLGELEILSRVLSLKIIEIHGKLKRRKGAIIANQILRSGTSIGANIAEGMYAQTPRDSASKFSIALKEAAETLYWLDLLVGAGFVPDNNDSREVRELAASVFEALSKKVGSVKKLVPPPPKPRRRRRKTTATRTTRVRKKAKSVPAPVYGPYSPYTQYIPHSHRLEFAGYFPLVPSVGGPCLSRP